ncbi:MAG: hypothetical protein AAB521_03340 [Patescibacteria group bacterium]
MSIETNSRLRILTHPDTDEPTGIVFLNPDQIKLMTLMILMFKAIELDYDMKLVNRAKTISFEHLSATTLEEKLVESEPNQRREFIEEARNADSLIFESSRPTRSL